MALHILCMGINCIQSLDNYPFIMLLSFLDIWRNSFVYLQDLLLRISLCFFLISFISLFNNNICSLSLLFFIFCLLNLDVLLSNLFSSKSVFSLRCLFSIRSFRKFFLNFLLAFLFDFDNLFISNPTFTGFVHLVSLILVTSISFVCNKHLSFRLFIESSFELERTISYMSLFTSFI